MPKLLSLIEAVNNAFAPVKGFTSTELRSICHKKAREAKAASPHAITPSNISVLAK